MNWLLKMGFSIFILERTTDPTLDFVDPHEARYILGG